MGCAPHGHEHDAVGDEEMKKGQIQMTTPTPITTDDHGTRTRNTSQRLRRYGHTRVHLLSGALIVGLASAGLWHGEGAAARFAPAPATRVMPLSIATVTGPVEADAPAAAPTARKGPGLPGEGDPRVYWDTIKRRVARGLHRSVASLTRLWSDHPTAGRVKGQPGPPPTTIYDIAIQEGLTLRQLRALELGSIQQACTALVDRHVLTHRQTVHRLTIIRGWPQSNLDGYVMYAFGKH